MGKPKLEDFWITEKDLIFCRNIKENLEKNTSNLKLTIAIFWGIICFSSFFLWMYLLEWGLFDSIVNNYLRAFSGFIILLLMILTGLPIIPLMMSLLIYHNKIIHVFSKKIILTLNSKLRNHLKLVAEYELKEDKYKKSLQPFLEEEYKINRLERQREEAGKKRAQIEKKHQEDYWFGLNGYVFEKEIELLFKKMWYKTNRTKWSWDGWVDIFVSRGGEKCIVQCKNHKKPVGPNIVRDLYGVLASEKADKAMLINSGWFTKGVHDFSKRNGIVLWDINDIVKCSAKYYQN